jgi:hypothetical protein
MGDLAPGTFVGPPSQSADRWWSIGRAGRVWLGPIIAGLIGLVTIHHPMLISGFAHVQSDGDDTRLINYLFEHSYRWFAGYPGHRTFWDIPFCYPARNTAAFSDTLLTIAPLYWLWRCAGFTPYTSFQIWLLITSLINYICGYWLLRSGFRCGTLGSTCGAFLFAFGASRINQLTHQQLLPQVYIVVTLVALLRIFVDRPSSFSRSVALWSIAGLSLAAQFYAAFYLGWFLVFALGLAGVWALVLPECRHGLVAVIREQWPAIAIATAASSLAIYPLFARYLQVASQVGMRSDHEILISIPVFRSWIYEGPHSWVWGWLCRLTPFMWQTLEQAQRMGIGVVTPVVCAAGLLQRWREPMVRLLGLTMLSLLIAVTRFERAIWEGAGAALWLVCAVDLFGSSRSVRHRQVAGALMVLLGLALFPVQAGALALILAALPYGASRFLPDHSRAVIRPLAPVIITGFPLITAFMHRPVALAIALVIAAAIEANARRTARRPRLQRLVIGALFIAGSLWFFQNQIIYWYVVTDIVPAARALRAVSRGLLLGLIPAAFGLACFLDQSVLRPRRLAAACILVLVCFLEQGVTTPSIDKAVWRARASELARQVDRRCTSFYYSPHHALLALNQYHLDAMWAQFETGVPTINGYSGVCPPGWLPLYEINVRGEVDIIRLGHALGHWAALNGLEPSEICWIGGRNEAIVRSSAAREERQSTSTLP